MQPETYHVRLVGHSRDDRYQARWIEPTARNPTPFQSTCRSTKMPRATFAGTWSSTPISSVPAIGSAARSRAGLS
jgi:hypothetical protein